MKAVWSFWTKPYVADRRSIWTPAYKPPDDDDNPAWGDLPYACDAPYSRDPARFVGPTRVVGRLPDLVGANELPISLVYLRPLQDTEDDLPMTTLAILVFQRRFGRVQPGSV